jgi:NTE family protein
VLDFNLSEKDKVALYDKGASSAREFLATWSWPDYLASFRS